MKYQTGHNLVNLMIGMVLSMIAVLASLTLFRSLGEVAIETRSGTNHDGQISSAMLMLQLELQNAGFGINDAGAAHIVSVDGGASSDQLYWRYKLNGAFECRKLIYTETKVSLGDAEDVSRLEIFKQQAGCTETSALEIDVTWEPYVVIANFNPMSAPNSSFLNVGPLVKEDCWPYGQGEIQSRYTVRIQVDGAVRNAQVSDAGTSVGISTKANEYYYCLTNLTGA